MSTNRPPFPVTPEAIAGEMKPVLESLEQKRIQSLQQIATGWKKIGITALVTVVAVVIVLAINASTGTPNPQPGSFGRSYQSSGLNFAFLCIPLIIIGIITGLVFYSKYINGHAPVYCDQYKRKVIAGMTKLIQPDMTYSPQRGISEQTFRETGLYDTDIDRYSSEDLFAGKIGKTALMFSEAHAEDKRTRRDSKGNTSTYWVTIFEGLLAIADFNKDFKSWVVIKPDFAESSFGWLGRTIQNFSPHLIRLENPEFEQAFVVHGNDQVEARYILTPDFQERLLELRKWFGADIRMSFHSSRMHLTIPNTENWFEPDIRRPAHDLSQMRLFMDQMGAVFRMVEMLDLNTRIWTKH